MILMNIPKETYGMVMVMVEVIALVIVLVMVTIMTLGRAVVKDSITVTVVEVMVEAIA